MVLPLIILNYADPKNLVKSALLLDLFSNTFKIFSFLRVLYVPAIFR